MLFFLAILVLYIPAVVFHPTKFLHKENIPKRGKKCIFAGNHYSNWDPIIYDAKLLRKFRILSKLELFKNKFVGLILKGLGGIPVDREHPAPSSYKKALGELNKNHQLLIFPEGTRNKSGSKELLEIKSGFLTFASRGDCEIIPMVMYQKPKIFRQNYVIFGKPFRVAGKDPRRLTKEEFEENLNRFLAVMKDLRNELDEYVDAKKHKKHKSKNKMVKS